MVSEERRDMPTVGSKWLAGSIKMSPPVYSCIILKLEVGWRLFIHADRRSDNSKFDVYIFLRGGLE